MKGYEIRVTYDGGIYIEAETEEEALNIASEIMLEETNYDMAKWLRYEVEEQELVK